MSRIGRRFEQAVQGIFFGGLAGALAAGIPGLVLGVLLGTGMLGGVVLVVFAACGVVGGGIGGSVAGLIVAAGGAGTFPRPLKSWKARLALASPVLLAFGLVLIVILLSAARPAPPPFVPRLIATPTGPSLIPSPEPDSIAVRVSKDLWASWGPYWDTTILPAMANLVLYAVPLSCLGYGALVGGRAVGALIRWEDQEDTEADRRQFSPILKPARPIDPELDG